MQRLEMCVDRRLFIASFGMRNALRGENKTQLRGNSRVAISSAKSVGAKKRLLIIDAARRWLRLTGNRPLCPRRLPQPVTVKKVEGSPYSITERRVPELIPVLGSQPAGDMNHKPVGRLSLLSARPAVTHATLKRAATNFAAW